MSVANANAPRDAVALTGLVDRQRDAGAGLVGALACRGRFGLHRIGWPLARTLGALWNAPLEADPDVYVHEVEILLLG
jgi:hypothetical protein